MQTKCSEFQTGIEGWVTRLSDKVEALRLLELKNIKMFENVLARLDSLEARTAGPADSTKASALFGNEAMKVDESKASHLDNMCLGWKEELSKAQATRRLVSEQNQHLVAIIAELASKLAEEKKRSDSIYSDWQAYEKRIEEESKARIAECREAVETLRDLIKRMLIKLPLDRHDSTTGRCAGCGAIHWCGDGKGKDPCKPDCIVQEAVRAAAGKEGA